MQSVSTTVPAPVGGWNARDPLDAMPPEDAVRLINFIPQPGSVVLRNGFRVHTPSGMGSGPVQTLAEYSSAAGSRKLIAGANGNLYDATTYNTAATSLASGFTNNKWQYANFKNAGGTNYLILCNGADTVQDYNGTTVANSTFSGVTLSTLVHVTVYKSRVYFVQKDTASIWYGGANASSGAMTEFAVGSLLRLGGYIQLIGSWSLNSNSDLNDLFVIISNMGEVLIYSGDEPGALNWGIVGRFYIGIPLGRRAGKNLGADFVVVTENGVYSMADLLQNTAPSNYNRLTDKITQAFQESAALYKSNFGWEGCVYPRKNLALINIPIVEGDRSDQYVINTLTGAWCRFVGMDASTFSLLNEKIYFGGMDGKVYEGDYGLDDNGAEINSEIRTAFNYLGNRGFQKQFLMARPIITASNSAPVFFDIDADFEAKQVVSSANINPTTTGGWDEATWDVDEWDTENLITRDWYSVSGIGYCCSFHIRANFTNTLFSLSAINVMYKPAGYL